MVIWLLGAEYISLHSERLLYLYYYCYVDSAEETMVLFSTPSHTYGDTDVLYGTPQKSNPKTMAFDSGMKGSYTGKHV